jgi:hypothetical protein
MERIEQIALTLQTARDGGAGTDGDVYLGICGREFYLDTDRDDFERGASITYVLGEGSNVHNASQNDPRDQFLYVEEALERPVYIRFHGKSRDDNWKLLRASVSLNESVAPTWDTARLFSFVDGGIWLGTRAGERVTIPKEDPLRTSVHSQAPGQAVER